VPEHDDLDLLGAITAPEQHHELQDTTQEEVKHRPRHKQRGCPLPDHAPAAEPQVKIPEPGFRTPQGCLNATRSPARPQRSGQSQIRLDADVRVLGGGHFFTGERLPLIVSLAAPRPRATDPGTQASSQAATSS
jgi:hypothetical protein